MNSPNLKTNKGREKGTIYALSAYTLWGLLPIYWLLVDQVPAVEILSHRIIWSFFFMTVLLIVEKKASIISVAMMHFIRNPKQLLFLILASLLISVNWLTYIWAVTNGHVVESSMGYYINPLVSILLGIIFLKERLNRWQMMAILLAACGVIVQTIGFGHFPWIALALALSFGFYALTKKMIVMDAALELTFETLCMLPAAFIYLLPLQLNGSAAFANGSWIQTVLLIGAGVVTAVPLLLFAEGAQRISLTMIGFLQYVSPTLTLLIGLFIFHESFSMVQFFSFAFIWAALIVFSLGSLPLSKRRRLPYSA